ncbi:FAD-dependent oxidoreductase [Saccharothrix australiensis]|uniref:Assimilatory nitrate reductase electron transfer subunit n=1 Tax=Saccharothrix australiensis TaxID=2072 RepID=A0A495VXH6_9PSEU|nr:FAD-dependent oxidoreductase [Saccharothrix australiensis]RKT54131.1 assimilatory nitrate reductase electron transfer subunit [Saccharothrix australiensis]
MNRRQVIVIGYGMAGARLADEIRARDPEGARVALTVVGAEAHPAYNRVLLSGVLAGGLDPGAVLLHEPDWADRSAVDLRVGVEATRVDRAARVVECSDGARLPYDAVVLATGSAPWLPPVEGLLDDDGRVASGVVAFRDLDDCARILAAARPGAPAVVLGGGLLGLEAARGLVARGSLVTVVHPVSHLMERQLDPGAGRVLADALERMGVEFRFGRVARRYVVGAEVELDDGARLPADLVVVSAGVRPATDLARDCGLVVERGVVVDDALRTSDPRIYALGDCAQHRGVVNGLVQPAWEQATVLADLLTGAVPGARYRGTPVVTKLKVRDIDLASLGEVHVELDEPGVEVLRVEDPTRGRYAKMVLRDNVIVGAILVGAPDAAATVVQLFDRGLPAPDDRLALLLGRALAAATAVSPADLPATTLVCRCNTVRKAQLVSAWDAGARGVAPLVSATRATTGCGTCHDLVNAIADWLAARKPAPA